MKTTWMLLITLQSLFISNAHAIERYEFYNGVRQMGMGGTAVTTVNDETALILNPAALGKLRNTYLTILDPELAGSTKNMGTLSKGGGATTGFTEPQELLNKLLLSPDSHFNALGQVFPSIVTTNFGFGLHAKYRYDGEVDTELNRFRYHYLNDVAMVMGFNFRIWDGRIKFGVNGRFIDRVEVNADSDYDALPTTSTGLQLKDMVREGVGVASDIGLILTAPWDWLPSLGAVWRDVGGTSYDLNDGFQYKTTMRPDMTAQTVDVGFSISPILGKRFRTLFSAEYRDAMTSGQETDQMRRMHLGLELNFADTLFFRGGMNQRYWTAGFEFSMVMVQLQVASYGEEIGTAAKPKEDRRYMGKLAIRF